METNDFPWPRIYQTNYRLLLVTKQRTQNLILSELFLNEGNVWIATPTLNLGNYLAIDQIEIADFGPFYIISTLGTDFEGDIVVRQFNRDINAPIELEAQQSFVEQIDPKCAAIINFNGQFIGGNVSSSNFQWKDLGANGILWSQIGSYDLNTFDQYTAGNRQLFLPNRGARRAKIVKLMKFGNTIVIYSDSSQSVLSPEIVGNTFTYSVSSVQGLGVRSANHVAGDEHFHGFIDLSGDFWTLGKPENALVNSNTLKRLGYREWINDLLTFDTYVSYSPRDNRFYISNKHQCLVINQFGAYHSHQLVSSVVDLGDGTIVGTFIDTKDREARITTDTLDYGSRGIKSIESITADLSHERYERAFYSVDWRMDRSLDFIKSKEHFDGLSGQAGIHVAGIDFRLKLRVTNYKNVILNNLLANIKYSEQRFKRGTVPAQLQTSSSIG